MANLILDCSTCYSVTPILATDLRAISAELDAREADGWRLRAPMRCPRCEAGYREQEAARCRHEALLSASVSSKETT